MFTVFLIVFVIAYLCYKEGENYVHTAGNRRKSIKNNSPVYHDKYGKMFLTDTGNEAVSGFSKNGDWVIRDVKTGMEYGRNTVIEKEDEEATLRYKRKQAGYDSTLVVHIADCREFWFGFPEPGAAIDAVYAVHDTGWLAYNCLLFFTLGRTIYDYNKEVANITLHFWLNIYSGEVALRDPRWNERNQIAEMGDNPNYKHIEMLNKRKHAKEKELGNMLLPIAQEYFKTHLDNPDKYKYNYYEPYNRRNGSTAWLQHIHEKWREFKKWIRQSGIEEAVNDYLNARETLRKWENLCFDLDRYRKDPVLHKYMKKYYSKWIRLDNLLYETNKERQEARRKEKKELETNIRKAKDKLESLLTNTKY